jgi:ABC-type xylose transport system substrate-binding protein
MFVSFKDAVTGQDDTASVVKEISTGDWWNHIFGEYRIVGDKYFKIVCPPFV